MACDREDADKAMKGLAALEQGLRFDPSPELARLFLSIYRYCGDLVLQRRFGEAGRYLRSLCATWREVEARELAAG
jgi:hypothetical protein